MNQAAWEREQYPSFESARANPTFRSSSRFFGDFETGTPDANLGFGICTSPAPGFSQFRFGTSKKILADISLTPPRTVVYNPHTGALLGDEKSKS